MMVIEFDMVIQLMKKQIRVINKKKIIVNSIVKDICSRILIGNLAAMHYSIKNDSVFLHFNEKTDESIYFAAGSRSKSNKQKKKYTRAARGTTSYV